MIGLLSGGAVGSPLSEVQGRRRARAERGSRHPLDHREGEPRTNLSTAMDMSMDNID